jgi:hypothetical protein
MNKYQALLSKKRVWTPVKPERFILPDEAREAVGRCLSLRFLELPVGEFIRDAGKGDLPQLEGVKELLLSNIVDEERHDLALNYIAEVSGISADYEAEAHRIVKAWIERPEHPVLKALVLERSVFFVILPLFRFLGGPGLRTTSADVSRDETVHVAANSAVCKDLGLRVTPELDKLRKATVSWMTQGLINKSNEKWYDRNFWMDQSDSLLYTGKAEGLIETKRARMPAFFEMSNSDLPSYA